jgi:hypothetical protein
MTKSQTVITTTIVQIVKYSKRETRPCVSNNAYESGSKASARQITTTSVRVIESSTYLLDEIDAEDENEGSDDANREESDHPGTGDEYTEATESE